jgi:hypothetical protein
MHGGSVSAASQGLGMGSTFTVRLPLENVAISTEPQESQFQLVACRS